MAVTPVSSSIGKVWQKSQCRFYFRGMTLSWEGQQPDQDRKSRLVWVTKGWAAHSLPKVNWRRRPAIHNREDSRRRNYCYREFQSQQSLFMANHMLQYSIHIIFTQFYIPCSTICSIFNFYYIKVSVIPSDKLIKTIRYPHMWRYRWFHWYQVCLLNCT